MKHPVKYSIIFLLLTKLVLALSTVPEMNVRQKRGLKFPTNAAMGMIIAIAVPLDLPERNIFVSYNFEANYNEPTLTSDISPGIFQRLDLVDKSRSLTNNETLADDTLATDDTPTVEEGKSRKRRSLLSRKKIYKILESKISK